ncbi:interferon-inducible double-stranded RNA-dependent protein kinase activator A homolog [Argonauta hians]
MTPTGQPESMTSPAGKTPISHLQELCTKRGLTPQYDLISNEGATHEPTYMMQVTVGEIVATGKGSSKKKAKHAAALAAYNQILGIKTEQQPEGGRQSPVSEEGIPGNPIGELQEFAQKSLIRPPIYDLDSPQGPPHAREFYCTVKLGKFQERGTGRSKKSAKRAAAHSMLLRIHSLQAEGTNTPVIEDSEEDEIPLSSEPRLSFYSHLKERVSHSYSKPKQIDKEIQQFYDKVVNSSAKKNNSCIDVKINYCQMLQEIAEVQRFMLTYHDLSERTTEGLFQCFVQMTVVPVAVCHGTGPTVEEGHGKAAHNALQYLKAVNKT